MSVGGLDDIHGLKNARRLDKGLPPLTEDTHDVCKHMRASSPPASAADLIDQQQQIRRSLRTAKKVILTILWCVMNIFMCICLVYHIEHTQPFNSSLELPGWASTRRNIHTLRWEQSLSQTWSTLLCHILILWYIALSDFPPNFHLTTKGTPLGKKSSLGPPNQPPQTASWSSLPPFHNTPDR